VNREAEHGCHHVALIETTLGKIAKERSDELIAEFRTTQHFQSDFTLSQLASLLLGGGDVAHISLRNYAKHFCLHTVSFFIYENVRPVSMLAILFSAPESLHGNLDFS
jgi:hypothetical protein